MQVVVTGRKADALQAVCALDSRRIRAASVAGTQAEAEQAVSEALGGKLADVAVDLAGMASTPDSMQARAWHDTGLSRRWAACVMFRSQEPATLLRACCLCICLSCTSVHMEPLQPGTMLDARHLAQHELHSCTCVHAV